jgi:hypothetical protein
MDENGKDFVDCITYDLIPLNNLVQIKEGATTYNFDIITLYNYYKSSNKLENPFTRTPFCKEIRHKIMFYIPERIIKFKVDETLIPASQSSPIGEIILASFQQTGDLNRILTQDIKINHKSVFTMDLDKEIGNVFENDHYNVTLCPPSSPKNLSQILNFIQNRKPNLVSLRTALEAELTYGSTQYHKPL